MTLNWTYTRTWRSHRVEDGKNYRDKCLFQIDSCTPYGSIMKEWYGYDLFHKGKKVKHGKKVKELKILAQQIVDSKGPHD